ncbi:MAG: sigma-70 family RNA polymerase sigma factor [Alphaproteobacteria bacterium]
MSDLDNYSDESLMAHVMSGDHRAFSILVERHSSRFYAAAYRVCGDAILAEDIVQDAFLKLWRKPAAFKPDKGAKFTTWFYRVVQNLAIDMLRRKKPQSDAGVIDFMADGSDAADDVMVMDEQQAALEVAIGALPERQKLALDMCFYEGLSNKEAAEILGVGVKALESLLMRAKKALKENLVYDDNERRVSHG